MRNSKHGAKLMARMLNADDKAHVLAGLRHLTVISSRYQIYHRDRRIPPSEEELERKWEALVKILQRCANLRRLTWKGTDQMPVILLETLGKFQPQVHLHVQDWNRLNDDDDHRVAGEIALANSPNLRSIQTKQWNTETTFDLRFAAFERIVALSPNLESVEISEGVSGCVMQGFSPEVELERAQLAKLFQTGKPSENSIISLKSRGGHHLDRLQRATDISALNSLYVHTLRFRSTAEQLPGLKQLGVDWINSSSSRGSDITGLNHFLLSIPPLESLHLYNVNRHLTIDMKAILKYQGPNLRALTLHDKEMPFYENGRPTTTPSQIRELSVLCPNLRDLEIDIDNSKTGDSEREIFAALAQFPNLEIVRLCLYLGLESRKNPNLPAPNFETTPQIGKSNSATKAILPPPFNPFNPFQTASMVANIWAILQHEREVMRALEAQSQTGDKEKMAKTKKIKELHLKIGEWEREIGFGHPAPWVLWEQNVRRYFVVKPSERDDRPDEIEVQKMDWKGVANLQVVTVPRLEAIGEDYGSEGSLIS
jgi:hypothetical protein